MTMQTIPLNHLVPSPFNVRKTGAKEGIDGLAASIAAHGLLQNLSVRPAESDGLFEVVAGGRRLAALQLLAKQERIAFDFPVPCETRDDADASEISLAENELRLPMHPADQFDAFKKLADQGKGPEEIAARFGTTAKTVMQRLKLALVSPKLIACYRRGEISLDCLMAFTVTDNHKQQEKVWKDLPEWVRQRPSHIRHALTEQHLAAESPLAQFVGMAAYEAAGGAVLRDLFDDENSGWFTDPALAQRLAAEKLDHAGQTVRGEGWKWVEIMPDLSWETLREYGRAVPERSPPTPDQQREIEALTAEGEAIMEEHGEEPQDQALQDRLWRIQERVVDLSEGEESWPDDAKANAGAVIGIGHEGALDIRRGLIRPEDKKAVRKANKAKRKTASAGKDKAPSPALPAALIEDLTAHRTAALQTRLAAQPKVALLAVVHVLALGLFYGAARSDSILRISPTATCLDHSAEDIEACKAAKELAAATLAMRKRLPKDPAKLWAWLTEQDQRTTLALLALCAAHSVDAVQKKHDPVPLDHANQLAAAVKLDMAAYWQPTAVGYFGRVSKEQTLEAVAEGHSKEAAENIARLKKGELVKEAEKRLKTSGWLPMILRSA
ncbi:MAG: ParB/RepB/Spo0J family partition protein [Alphaproteobacteria bacterium]|nr:ParB/RepB/Spo0J family partition protein [Alphaproteobacteria bacterium]